MPSDKYDLCELCKLIELIREADSIIIEEIIEREVIEWKRELLIKVSLSMWIRP